MKVVCLGRKCECAVLGFRRSLRSGVLCDINDVLADLSYVLYNQVCTFFEDINQLPKGSSMWISCDTECELLRRSPSWTLTSNAFHQSRCNATISYHTTQSQQGLTKHIPLIFAHRLCTTPYQSSSNYITKQIKTIKGNC